ncbi:hypothetical protein BGC_14140 [Burkholderia sp. 3C]
MPWAFLPMSKPEWLWPGFAALIGIAIAAARKGGHQTLAARIGLDEAGGTPISERPYHGRSNSEVRQKRPSTE